MYNMIVVWVVLIQRYVSGQAIGESGYGLLKENTSSVKVKLIKVMTPISV